MTKRTHRDELGKTCTKCSEYKLFDQYYRLATTSDKRQSWCKSCTVAHTTATAIARRARDNKTINLVNQEAKQRALLRQWVPKADVVRASYTYKISRERAARLKATRNCESCCRPIGGKTVHIDHDYVTGIVRGVLCPNCNTGIGKLGDTLQGVEQATYYLVASVDVLALASEL